MTKVYDAEGLADAINNGDDTIEIEGDFANKVIRIKATGTVAWAIAIGAIAIAVTSIILTIPTAGTSEIANFVAAPIAVSVLGIDTTYAAILIAIAAGGVGVLSTIRNYREVAVGDNYIKLRKK